MAVSSDCGEINLLQYFQGRNSQKDARRRWAPPRAEGSAHSAKNNKIFLTIPTLRTRHRLRRRRHPLLGHATVNVGVIAGGTQANISRHLQSLAGAGVLARRKDGLQVLYSIADPSIYRLCDLVCGSIEKQIARQAGAFGAGA